MKAPAPPGSSSRAKHDLPPGEPFFRLPEALDAACAQGWYLFVADPPRSHQLAQGVLVTSREPLSRAWAGLCVANHDIRGARFDEASEVLDRSRESFGELRDSRGAALAEVSEAYLDIGRGETQRALEALGRVVERYALSERIAPLDYFLAFHAIALAYGRQGSLERALQHHYANLLLLEQSGSPSPIAVVLLNLSSTLMAIDDWEESLALALRAVQCCEHLNNSALKRRAEVNVALAYRFLGRIDDALALLQRLRAEPYRDPGSDFALYLNSAEALAHHGDVEGGRRWLARARQCASPAGDPHERANLTWIAGLVAAGSGDLAEAIAQLEAAKREVIALRKLHVPLLPRVVEVLASCYARSGDHARAFETFQQFHATHEARLGYTTRARYDGWKSRRGVAAIETGVWRERAEGPPGADLPATHALLNEALRRTLAVTADEDGEALPGWTPRSIARMDAEARRLGVEARYVGGVLDSLHRAPDPSTLEGPSQSVRVALLGALEIRIGHRPLPFGRKRPERPLALLKYLATHPRREAPEVEIADDLWPDLDGDAALRALAVTLHRLRHLLGGADTITLHDRRLAINAHRVWCDAAAFEWLLDRAAASGGEGERDRLTRQAIALYRGDLPVDEDREPWALAARRRLCARFVSASAAQGARLAAATRWEEASASFRGGLERDALAEELCLGLMRCCLALERPDQGIAAYRSLELALLSHGGTRPSAAIETLYRELLTRLGRSPPAQSVSDL